ncbi:MAG TPA: NAD(+) diphosphatase [Stellaceae bacterium]|nr:NAD(+) diphosphatase [Stellaceae bacterium]
MEEIYCFAGNPLDRASQRRQDPRWIAALLDDPQSLVLPLIDLKPLVREGTPAALDWRPMAEWRGLIDAGADPILLGLDERRAYFALDAGTGDKTAATADARALAAQIAGGEAAILGEARALIDWHNRHRFCARCGTPSLVASGGWLRRCPNCEAHHFPRVDPVVIMLAIDGDRCLLGRNKRRAGARFSCLAGFMEPGETPEEAVRREILEESGIRTGRVRYLGAQPWPFPSSLMMGFLAEAQSTEIVVDPDELAEARWFDRDEVRAMVARSLSDDPAPALPSLPPPLAIGHQICRRWAVVGESV